MFIKKIVVLILLTLIFSCSNYVENQGVRGNNYLNNSGSFPTIKENLDADNEEDLRQNQGKVNFNFEDEPTLKPIKSKKKIKIATILPLSGTYSLIGLDALDTIKMFDDINVEVQIFNSAANELNIPLIAQDIKDKNFDAIVGPIFNYETLALSNYETELPIISLSNDVTVNKPNVLIFGTNNQDKVIDVVSFLKSKNLKNFSILLPNSAYGSNVYKNFKKAINIYDSKLIRVEFYDDTGISNPSKYVSKIVNGLVETNYIPKFEGEILTERQFEKLKESNENFSINDYIKEDLTTDVIFVFGGKKSDSIIKVLNSSYAQSKLKNNIVFFLDQNEGNSNYIGKGLEYDITSPDLIAFHKAFEMKYGRSPNSIASLLFDAISYVIYVDNKSYKSIKIKDFQNKYDGFYGLNGNFIIRNNNSVKRFLQLKSVNKININDILIEKNSIDQEDKIEKTENSEISRSQINYTLNNKF
jgi:hypothetical protein